MNSNLTPEWERPATIPPLSNGEVQVWRLDLREAAAAGRVAGAEQVLCGAELVRAGRMRAGLVRDEFTAARGLLRRVLGAAARRDPRELELSFGPNGKPSLAGDMGIEFNVSHSRGLILVAISRAEAVGVDVEYADPAFANADELLRIATQTFSADEVSRIAGGDERLPAFYDAWTRGEAIAKADGCGIASPLNYRVSEADDLGERRVSLVRADGSGEGTYFVRSLLCGVGYAAAFAGLRSQQQMAFFNGDLLFLPR